MPPRRKTRQVTVGSVTIGGDARSEMRAGRADLRPTGPGIDETGRSV
jgi:hypothetical protein